MIAIMMDMVVMKLLLWNKEGLEMGMEEEKLLWLWKMEVVIMEEEIQLWL